jgi:hypothetical protein
MDVVVDEVLAEEAEEFAGAVVAAVGGAVVHAGRSTVFPSFQTMTGWFSARF